MIRQVSSTLLAPTDKLKVQLTVGLLDAQNNPAYCSMYNFKNSQYLNISPFANVVIKYVEKGRPWSKQDNIYVTPRNIFGLKTELEMFYNNLMSKSEKLYTYGSNGYITSINNVDMFRRTISLNGQLLLLEPIVIYDSLGKPLPGICMFINNKINMIELSMEEFESFYNLFMTINIHQEGMLLLQTYISMCMKSGGLKIPVDNAGNSYTTSMKDVSVNIFERASDNLNSDKEIVSGPPVQKNGNYRLEDLP